MTITKHEPVVPSRAVADELDKMTSRGLLDLRRANPPRWLDEWIDLNLYRHSTVPERRQIALDGLERQAQAKTAERAERAAQEASAALVDGPAGARASKVRPAVIHLGRRVRPGTPYVPCAGGCNHMLLRFKPSVAYCDDCTPTRRGKRKPAAADLDAITYL